MHYIRNEQHTNASSCVHKIHQHIHMEGSRYRKVDVLCKNKQLQMIAKESSGTYISYYIDDPNYTTLFN